MINRIFLLADDDADDAFLFCEAIGLLGPAVECRTAENGSGLFKQLSETGDSMPDMIFLDINMPVMNGWDCLVKLKENELYRPITTIMYSTSSNPRDVEKAYELGAALFITKPDNFNELCRILRAAAFSPKNELISRLKEFANVKIGRANEQRPG